MPPPAKAFPVFLLNGESFYSKQIFLAVGSSLGHLSMKIFSDLSYCLGPKVRQREGAGGGPLPPNPLIKN